MDEHQIKPFMFGAIRAELARRAAIVHGEPRTDEAMMPGPNGTEYRGLNPSIHFKRRPGLDVQVWITLNDDLTEPGMASDVGIMRSDADLDAYHAKLQQLYGREWYALVFLAEGWEKLAVDLMASTHPGIQHMTEATYSAIYRYYAWNQPDQIHKMLRL